MGAAITGAKKNLGLPFRQAKLTFVACSLALLMTGCAYLREAIGLGPQRPTVQLSEVAVVRATLLTIDLAVTLRVDNPNDFDLSFAKLHYTMEAGGRPLAAGDYDDKIRVPATGRSLIKLPLSIDALNAMRLVHETLVKSQDTELIMKANADFDTPVGPMQVSFEDKRPLKSLAGF